MYFLTVSDGISRVLPTYFAVFVEISPRPARRIGTSALENVLRGPGPPSRYFTSIFPHFPPRIPQVFRGTPIRRRDFPRRPHNVWSSLVIWTVRLGDSTANVMCLWFTVTDQWRLFSIFLNDVFSSVCTIFERAQPLRYSSPLPNSVYACLTANNITVSPIRFSRKISFTIDFVVIFCDSNHHRFFTFSDSRKSCDRNLLIIVRYINMFIHTHTHLNPINRWIGLRNSSDRCPMTSDIEFNWPHGHANRSLFILLYLRFGCHVNNMYD